MLSNTNNDEGMNIVPSHLIRELIVAIDMTATMIADKKQQLILRLNKLLPDTFDETAHAKMFTTSTGYKDVIHLNDVLRSSIAKINIFDFFCKSVGMEMELAPSSEESTYMNKYIGYDRQIRSFYEKQYKFGQYKFDNIDKAKPDETLIKNYLNHILSFNKWFAILLTDVLPLDIKYQKSKTEISRVVLFLNEYSPNIFYEGCIRLLEKSIEFIDLYTLFLNNHKEDMRNYIQQLYIDAINNDPVLVQNGIGLTDYYMQNANGIEHVINTIIDESVQHLKIYSEEQIQLSTELKEKLMEENIKLIDNQLINLTPQMLSEMKKKAMTKDAKHVQLLIECGEITHKGIEDYLRACTELRKSLIASLNSESSRSVESK